MSLQRERMGPELVACVLHWLGKRLDKDALAKHIAAKKVEAGWIKRSGHGLRAYVNLRGQPLERLTGRFNDKDIKPQLPFNTR